MGGKMAPVMARAIEDFLDAETVSDSLIRVRASETCSSRHREGRGRHLLCYLPLLHLAPVHVRYMTTCTVRRGHRDVKDQLATSHPSRTTIQNLLDRQALSGPST